MIWVVNTNTNTCHIYQFQKKPAHIQLLKEIHHPENRSKKGDYFTSDKPGQYHGVDTIRGAYSPETDPREVEIENFSREIAHQLEQGRNQQGYQQLVIIAPPHMNGLLFRHLTPLVRKMVRNNIKKDFPHITESELLHFLIDNTRFPDE